MFRCPKEAVCGKGCSDVPRKPFAVGDVQMSPGSNLWEGMFRCPTKVARGMGYSDIARKLFVVWDVQMSPA